MIDGRPDLNRALAAIDQHIPSLTDENEETIRNSAALLDPYDIEREPADLAIRTCACGMEIDGFYEYVDHLKEVIRAL